MDPRVDVLPDEAGLAGRAASVIASAITDAANARGRCSLAVSRLSVPALWHQLARSRVDWALVDLFQVDERLAPRGTDERNLTGFERDLVERIDGPRPTLHAMPVDGDEVEAAAARYAEELEAVCGSPPVLDVVHLGIGPDGHTASLIGNDPVLDVFDRDVAVTQPFQGYRRMTLTFPILDRAAVVVFVVYGSDKRDALRAVLDNDTTKPAARLQAGNVVLLTDVVP